MSSHGHQPYKYNPDSIWARQNGSGWIVIILTVIGIAAFLLARHHNQGADHGDGHGHPGLEQKAQAGR